LTFEANVGALSQGIHAVSVTVVDNTARVRDDALRAQWMTASRDWTISVLGVPDECACPPPVALEPGADGVTKSRYLSITIPPLGATGDPTVQALRVRAVELGTFGALNGQFWWVGPPTDVPDPVSPGGSFAASRLQCAPHFTDWTAFDSLAVYGPEIVPGASYEVDRVDDCCPSLDDAVCYSAALGATTGTWGDAVAPYGGVTQPDFADVTALVEKFKSAAAGVALPQVELVPEILDHEVDFADITAGVDAFKGLPYPYAGPTACP
jgi:hypothetical protein